jgi:hypothetical protein
MGIPPAFGDIVADWDATALTAVVPPSVKAACVQQADSILAATREERLNEINDGVRVNSTGGASEQYSASAPGASTGLCRRAYQLLQKYKLASGRLL